MGTDTFTYSGSAETWTAPSNQTVTIKIWGPDGGSGGAHYYGGSGGSGGSGGYIEVEYNVSSGETLDVYVGGSGQDAPAYDDNDNPAYGGWGYKNGGNGGVDGTWTFGNGGAGGGATAILNNSDSVIASAGGGGGGSGGSDGELSCGGGGGARGGQHNDTRDTSGSTGEIKAEDGGGTGNGGDGAPSVTTNSGDPGGDGGYVHSLGTLINSSTGANSGNGKIEIIYASKPSDPSNLSASVSQDDISLSWTDNSNNEDGFYIYRATSSGSSTSDYTQIDSVGSNTTSYTNGSLLDGEKYFYRVSAYNTDGESDLSNETSEITSLPAPSNFTLSL